MLRRTETGPFEASQCITLQALEALDENERMALLLPVQTLLDGHETVTLDADDAGRFLSGLRRRGAWPDRERVAVFGPVPAGDEPLSQEAVLLGSAHTQAGELIPGRLLSPIEIQQILETSPELAS